jgi:hypothetical protein
MHRPANGIRPLLEAQSEAGYRGPLLSLWRIMRRFLVLLLTAFTALSVTASSASTPRFEGYVGGAATGKGEDVRIPVELRRRSPLDDHTVTASVTS